ncbi:CASP-like protein 5A1 [Hibiscus syriacus]|uniref:CASP-like protein n=1 Tax=Hibiscus syriacus TaxID=106335 RepID=A0A6A2WB58_HIBSY|nr:CASP-like protein 5A1 [Hibiscus syriacus]
MNVSHTSVHPVEDLPTTDGGVGSDGPNNNEVEHIQGMPGTAGGLALRICQFVSAVLGIFIMATISDFPSVTAFCYLVAATSLQSLWSLSQAIIDVYALLVMRSLQNYRVVSLFVIGDGITSTLTFAAACASAGITVLIDNRP